MKELNFKALIHNGVLNLEADNKLILFDFFKDSLTAIDIILQTHSNINLDINLNGVESILDLAVSDVIKNIHGNFKEYTYKNDMSLDVNLFIKESSENELPYYLNYNDIETNNDFIKVSLLNNDDMFNELVIFVYNNFVKFVTEYLTEIIPEINKNYQRINLYRMELVQDFFFSERERGLYDSLFDFYDSIVHTQYPDIKVIDVNTHDKLGGK